MKQKTINIKPRNEAESTLDAATIPAGVVGLGVMGAVVATGLLVAGHPVFAMALEASERRTAKRRIRKHLAALHDAGVLGETPEEAIKRLQVSGEFSTLASCQLVVESIIEDLPAKHVVLQKIEEAVSRHAVIGSNTSGLPITEIQKGAKNPRRVLGLHWVSSSPFVRVVEIMGGEHTSRGAIKRAQEFVRLWGKIPALSRRDKRGFICNRIGYALLREAFALLDEGMATPQEIDDSIRASVGTIMPFAGPFGYLDLTGPAAYATVMRDLFPDLSCEQGVPKSLQKLIDSGGEGIVNGRGFYRYAPGEGERKREEFDNFRRDVTALIEKYEEKLKRK